MRRLFIDTVIDENNPYISITNDDAKHLLYSMRVRPKQIFIIVDKEKHIAKAEIISCTKSEVHLKFLNYIDDASSEPPINVVIAQCLPKSDKMDYIVQKAVELGANSIIPVYSKHCVVKYDDKKKKNRQKKWQKIADEAVKQCGRTIKPVVENIINLDELINHYAEYTKFVCYEAEEKQSFKNILKSTENDKFLILIGPEGGFSKEEILFCLEHDFKSISLGKRILRTETASLTALAIVMYEKGDLGNEF